jgi:protoporphyrinogen IX oxidase
LWIKWGLSCDTDLKTTSKRNKRLKIFFLFGLDSYSLKCDQYETLFNDRKLHGQDHVFTDSLISFYVCVLHIMILLVIKTIHILAIISWMAAMLYLPRLFVYHADVAADSAISTQFKIMEKRLLKAIMTPAMIVSWLTGLYLAWMSGYLSAGWLHSKLLLVFAMSGVHGLLSATVRRFATDENQHSSRYFRVLNEVPTLLMIGIVALVVIKPF